MQRSSAEHRNDEETVLYEAYYQWRSQEAAGAQPPNPPDKT